MSRLRFAIILVLVLALAVLAAPVRGPYTSASGATDTWAPTDVDRLNMFAVSYNLYLEQLRKGIIDTKRWEKTEKAWQRLTER